MKIIEILGMEVRLGETKRVWTSHITKDTIVQESLAKRVFDFTLALIGSILLFPIAVAIAIAIVLEDWGPVFYVQKRVGKNNKVFNFYKFRTMRANADQLPPLRIRSRTTASPRWVGFCERLLSTNCPNSSISSKET